MKQLITRRYISVFDNKTELLVSDINISINADSKLKLLQTLFNERLENPMYDEYAINQSNFVKLEEILGQVFNFDFNQYSYALSCEAL